MLSDAKHLQTVFKIQGSLTTRAENMINAKWLAAVAVPHGICETWPGVKQGSGATG